MEYIITIIKREKNPEYNEKSNRYVEIGNEQYIEYTKTMATLNEEQWQKVQKAIIEAI